MPQTIQHATVDALRARLAQGGACQVIDVREVAEYDAEHIAEARLLPLSAFEPQAAGLDPQQTVYVVCRSGTRALQAAARLQQRGHVDGGPGVISGKFSVRETATKPLLGARHDYI